MPGNPVSMPTVRLRPATPADSEFCYEVNRAAMGEYIELLWGWDETVQRRLHTDRYDPAATRIILADGQPAGMLVARWQPTEVCLEQIKLLPTFQGSGVGSRLIRELLDEASREGLPVLLDVLAVNERAQALYRRLGFRELYRHGDRNHKIRMKGRAPS